MLLAHEAEKDPRVSLWRERALGGRLLAPQALAGWIRTVAAEQPPEPNTLPVRFIQFPENGWVVSLPVRAGGILDQLERLAQSLARIFDWHPAEAVAFIATGQVPQFRLYRVRFTRQFVIPRLSRITLELCPTLSPRQVARLYDAMRKSVLSGRPKRLSERQLKLVLFRLTHHQLSHRDALRRWNRAYRRWAYRRLDNFKRDVRVAIERLASLPFA
ncbi:MAG: hypothetical protein NZM33_15790 [Bryobacteraceae bacterium]|nr:hypothetical protein [Bryobacteraceae bacterium]